MKQLRDLQAGDKFRYAENSNGGVYVRGCKVGGSHDLYYIHSTVIGYIYMGQGGDDVIVVEG